MKIQKDDQFMSSENFISIYVANPIEENGNTEEFISMYFA